MASTPSVALPCERRVLSPIQPIGYVGEVDRVVRFEGKNATWIIPILKSYEHLMVSPLDAASGKRR
jgi:hypothetical protein